MRDLLSRGRMRIKENVEYVLRDANGNVKPIFQQNALFTWLLKHGIVSPHFYKIPFLLGTWRKSANVSNLITNAGFAGVASRIGGAGAEAAFDYIAVGTGTTAAAVANTTLETELATSGLSRAQGTVSRQTTDVSNDTARVTHTFSVTGTAAVTESGVLNAASSGVLLCRQVFSAINVSNGDSLAITWDIDVD